MKIEIELTDTFGGEANYSWVRRYTLDEPENISQRALVRRIKRVAGITGVRCNTDDHGGMITIRPVGACVVLFATFS
jgi:hypothetical protein